MRPPQRSACWLVLFVLAAVCCLTACGSAPPVAYHGGFGPNDATARGPMEGPAFTDEDRREALDEPLMNAQVVSRQSRSYGDAESEELMISGSSSGGDEMRMATKSPARDLPAGASGLPPPSTPPAPPPPVTKRSEAAASAANQNAAEAESGLSPTGVAGAVQVRSPMLIYTAGLAMIVTDVKASLAGIEALTRDLGGFLARRDNVSLTIRIPVARFDEAVRRIEAMGEVVHRRVTVEDVTEEFTDLEVRLRNLRAIRARLEKLLEKAKGVEEAVLLERELGRVAGEIDRIEGRMKLLRDRAAYSTITVTLRERAREAIDRAGPRLPVDWLGQLGLGRLMSL